MSIREMLAENLSFYRKKAGFTQKSAAIALDTRPTTISSWERGVSQPSADMLVSIALKYGVSLSDLCGMDYKQAFTSEEKEIIASFRMADEIDKQAVRRILGIREKKDTSIQAEIS